MIAEYIQDKEVWRVTLPNKARRTMKPWKGTDGIRGPKFVDRSRTLFLKTECITDKLVEETQTFQEAQQWLALDRQDRKRFAPVLAFGICYMDGERVIWLIMPYIQGTPSYKAAYQSKVIERLTKKYDLSDMHTENVFDTDKGPVIIDYG